MPPLYDTIPVKTAKVYEDSVIPKYETPGAAGFDLPAYIPPKESAIPNSGDLYQVERESITLWPGQRVLVGTGLRFAIPRGLELQIRPRSGLANKYGISVVNSPGTVDSDFRGEVKVILINHGDRPLEINHGDRICQGVLAEVPQAHFVLVDELDETERGVGGFGSTGVAL